MNGVINYERKTIKDEQPQVIYFRQQLCHYYIQYAVEFITTLTAL